MNVLASCHSVLLTLPLSSKIITRSMGRVHIVADPTDTHAAAHSADVSIEFRIRNARGRFSVARRRLGSCWFGRARASASS